MIDAMPLMFRVATPHDVGRVLSIVRARAQWIAARGSRQWSIYLRDEGEALVERLVATGRTMLVTRDGIDVGTLRIDWTDEHFWGGQGLDGQAGYVHTLAVSPDCAGQSLGTQLLQWAARRVLEEGRPLLRLDCSAKNHGLIAYYTARGFEARRVVNVDVDPDYVAQQFERSAALPF